jgi:hypothetical protein
MTELLDVGRLMHLPLQDIKPGPLLKVSNFVVQAAAQQLRQAEAKKQVYLPLIVKQLDRHTYEVTSNAIVYAVAKAAGLERVWCVVTDPSPELETLTKILIGEQTPKINLSCASAAEIHSALEFVSQTEVTALKGLDVAELAEKLAAANRETWQDFSPIGKLGKFIKSGKSATSLNPKKLEALATVFYLTPKAPPNLPAPTLSNLKKATRQEIMERLQYLAQMQISGFDQIDLDKAADEIFTEPKGKWKTSFSPIAKLNCGISTAQAKVLSQVFTLK